MGTGCGARVDGARSAAMNTSSDDAIRRKRLLWRATHRGIKEMDLILGGFVERHIAELDQNQLAELEAIIEIPDQEMLTWATLQEPIPQRHASPLLLQILERRS
jgi:antitoxin CptB